MTREKTREEVLNIPNHNILLELPTGFGKTKTALELVKNYPYKDIITVLIVVPRNVLKDEWKKEIIKWSANYDNIDYNFTTYVSFPKYAGNWDIVIFDECHHLSDRCQDALLSYKIDKSILLSATVNRELKKSIYSCFPDLYCYKVRTKDAIDNGILPDPKVYLLPLTLDNSVPNQTIIRNPKINKTVHVDYSQRWMYLYKPFKSARVELHCTEQQYNDWMDFDINRTKNRYISTRLPFLQNKWLQLCSVRLKWLSQLKTEYIKTIQEAVANERTLTFCNGIKQTEELGEHCINSKNKASQYNLECFNKGEINHITACNMLDEGMNLVDCRVGIYANLNSSERIIKQKLGRLLRHKDPILIIPYYKGTREEEIVAVMLEDYNKDLVTVINNLNEIQL